MSLSDPYEVSYPVVKRVYWAEVLPGMMFCFHKLIVRLGDAHSVFNDKSTVWTVIAKTWHAPPTTATGRGTCC